MLRKRNYSRDAVMEAGRSRLRPVLMTRLPPSWYVAHGSQYRNGKRDVCPAGHDYWRTVSVLTTLILVPTMYTALYHRTLIEDRISVRLARNR